MKELNQDYFSFLQKVTQTTKKMNEDEKNFDFREEIKIISKTVSDLEPLLADLDSSFDSTALELKPQIFSSLSAKYANVIGQVDRIIRLSQNVLTKTDESYHPSRPHTPIAYPISRQNSQQLSILRTPSPADDQNENSQREISIHRPREMFDLFTSREMPISHLPYPSLCGALPLKKGESVPIDGFVAAILDTEYVLCYVADEREDTYLIVDADADEPVLFERKKEECIPLPTSVPDSSLSTLEYPVGTQVLSLYPNSDDHTWTSTFYKATVVQPPSKRSAGYAIKFENDTYDWIEVPIQFVIPAPK